MILEKLSMLSGVLFLFLYLFIEWEKFIERMKVVKNNNNFQILKNIIIFLLKFYALIIVLGLLAQTLPHIAAGILLYFIFNALIYTKNKGTILIKKILNYKTGPTKT